MKRTRTTQKARQMQLQQLEIRIHNHSPMISNDYQR